MVLLAYRGFNYLSGGFERRFISYCNRIAVYQNYVFTEYNLYICFVNYQQGGIHKYFSGKIF